MKVFGWIALSVGLIFSVLALVMALNDPVDWGGSATAVALAGIGWVYAGIALIKPQR